MKNEPSLVNNYPLRVAVVGPCASGKSSLIPALNAAGFEGRHPAQEHSLVPDMWRRLTNPDILIFLDVSYAAARQRRPYHDGGPQRLTQQHRRLAHAQQNSDLYLDTSKLTREEVRDYVLSFLRSYT